MTDGTMNLRIGVKEWKFLRRYFKGIKGESVANYLRRYVEEIRKNEKYND